MMLSHYVGQTGQLKQETALPLEIYCLQTGSLHSEEEAIGKFTESGKMAP